MWMPPVYVDLECVSLLCFDVREIGAEWDSNIRTGIAESDEATEGRDEDTT